MKKCTYIVVSTLLIVTILNLVFSDILIPNNFFSENSAFYFLSSLLQGNAAILSITGVFYIFKIQSLQSSIDIIKSTLMADFGRRSWPEDILKFDKLILAEKETYLKSDNAIKAIQSELDEWTSKERNIKNLKIEIKFPFVVLSIGIIIEAICLFTANFIHVNHSSIEYHILFFNLLLEFFIIFVVTKGIFKALN